MKKIITAIAILLLISTSYSQTVEEEFENRNGPGWDIGIYEWGYISYVVKEKPSETLGPILSQAQILSDAESFLETNSDLFGMEKINVINIDLLGGEDPFYQIWIIEYEGQYYEGVPVLDSYTKLLMRVDGEIYGAGNQRFIFEKIDLGGGGGGGDAVGAAQAALGIDENPTEIERVVYNNNGVMESGWAVNFDKPVGKSVIVNDNGIVVKISNWSLVKTIQDMTVLDYSMIAASFLMLFTVILLLRV